MKKRLIYLFCTILFCGSLLLCACDDKSATATNYSLGETVQTDIAKFTLSNAELAIKLNTTSTGTYEEIKSGNSKISDEYFTADEYNADEDLGKAYVASKGHAYVVIEFCIENLDRGALDIGDSFFGTPLFGSVVYNGESYDNYTTQYGAVSSNGYEWARYDSVNILLQAGETSYYRCYIDIPVDADSLNDEFDLIVTLPNSDDSSESFTYHVTPSDKSSTEETEMSLDEAIYKFRKQDGNEYFKNHKNDYSLMSTDEIYSIIDGQKFNVALTYGEYDYVFESSNNILETALSLSDKPTGYLNNLTWSVSENSLIISGKNVDYYEMHKVQDGIYVGYVDGEPKLLLTK